MNSYEQAYLDKKAQEDPRERLLLKAEQKVRDAKLILFIIGGLMLGSAIFYYLLDKLPNADVIFNVVYGLVFIGLGFLVKSYPKQTIIIGIILYVLKIALAAYITAASLFSGLFFKVIFIYALYKGFKAVNEAVELRRELGRLDETNADNQPIDLIN
jgi:F0F1-type ATP synthase assembly protein I